MVKYSENRVRPPIAELSIRALIQAIRIMMEKFERQSQRHSRYTLHSIRGEIEKLITKMS